MAARSTSLFVVRAFRLSGAVASWINHGRRLHLQHGPIDLIIEAQGAGSDAAYRAAAARFSTVLQELVDELALLRTPTHQLVQHPCGRTAVRMVAAVQQFSGFTTPMIAVAGSVADEVMAAMLAAGTLERVCVNNGGDIALHVAAGHCYKAGIVADPRSPAIDATVTIQATDGIGGIATSGRHGRSYSTGIADAVTVLASSAALADTAATLIANAVDLPGCSAVKKIPACELDPESDLGETPVTVDVGEISDAQIEHALDAGIECAQAMYQHGLIHSVCLYLRGQHRVHGAIMQHIHSTASLTEELSCPI